MKEEKECVCERETDLQGSVSSRRDFTHGLARKARPGRARLYEALRDERVQMYSRIYM